MFRGTAASVAVTRTPVSREHPVYHIVEQPGGVEHMTDCEVPTEEYYDRLTEDLRRRHPKAASWVLEHASVWKLSLTPRS